MISIWYVLFIFSLSKCYAWETSATSEALSALIDKLIAQTDVKPAKEDTSYREAENDNARAKFVNDSNIIYIKLMPNETHHLTLHPNTTNLNLNNLDLENNSNGQSKTENIPEKRFIERNIQHFNSTNNKDVLKKILHDIKHKIENKPEKETEHKLRTPDIANSNEEEQTSSHKNIRSGFDNLLRSENPPDIILSKKTIVLDDANVEKILPDILTTIKKQIPPIEVNNITELLKQIFEVKQTKEEKLSQVEHIPSRRRYSSNEVTSTNLAPRSNIRNPSLFGSLDISKTVPNYQPLSLCGNCKQLGLVNLPLNNILHNNARLQEAVRRSFIGNLVNTIRPNLLYKHFNGIFK